MMQASSFDGHGIIMHPPHQYLRQDDDDDDKEEEEPDVMEQLEQALEKIPIPEKLAYLEALGKCPGMVRSTAPAFLRCHDNAAWGTAHRLVAYWEWRLQTLGNDRAFLALDLSGRGALDETAIAALKTGYLCILPNDKHGCPVLYIDASKLLSNNTGEHVLEISEQAILRSSFYIWSVLSQNETGQTDGFVALAEHNDAYDRLMHSSAAFRKITQAALQYFPLKSKASYLVKIVLADNNGGENNNNNRPLLRKPSSSSSLASPSTATTATMTTMMNPIQASSRAELGRKLDLVGLASPYGLPVTMGGTWQPSIFLQWIEIQCLSVWATTRDQISNQNAAHPYYGGIVPGGGAFGIMPTSPSLALPASNRAAVKTKNGSRPTTATAVQSSDDDQVVIQEGLAMLEEALSLMDESETAAYLEAKQQVPHLVGTESNPLRFLRCEDFDAWGAARRLTKYWTTRKQYFGDRCLRPMHQTEAGALSADDKAFVRGGSMLVLPPDRNGRPVLTADRTRAPASTSTPTILRSLFYLTQVLSENEVAQELGAVCLFPQSHTSKTKPINLAVVQCFEEIFETVMPIRLVEVHMLCPAWLSNEGLIAKSQGMKSLMKFSYESHVASTPNELLSQLESIGLTRQSVLLQLGGDFDERTAAMWHVDRESVEIERQQVFENAQKELRTGQNQVLPTVAINENWYEENIIVGLERAMADLPPEEKKDYLFARDTVPDLVARESSPMVFLKVDDYNATAAARRLAKYWRVRCNLFGERALLPMNATGHGALCEEDIKHHNAGNAVVLPNDSAGHSVIFVQTSNANQVLSSASAMLTKRRVHFYVIHLMANNPLTQSEGFVMVVNWRPPFVLQKAYQSAADLIDNVMPVRLFAHRVLCLPLESDQKTCVESVFPRLMNTSSDSLIRSTFVHIADSKVELCKRLECVGFQRSGLPTQVGGLWEFETDCKTWFDERLRSETIYQSQFSARHGDLIQLRSVCSKHAESSVDSRPPIAEKRMASTDVRDTAGDLLGNEMNHLPDFDKIAYLEAIERVPRLVARETGMFLSAEGGNPRAAATRLTTYWRKRKELFRDRAMLKMNQTGEGSLEKSDISLMGSGNFCVLPCDNLGRPVVYICDTQTRKKDRHQAMLRVIFYLGTVAAELEKAQTEGCVVLLVLKSNELDDLLVPVFELFTSILPLLLHQVHVVVHPLAELNNPVTHLSGIHMSNRLRQLLQSCTCVHSGRSSAEIFARLSPHGFSIDNIPTKLGGKWTHAQFFQWQEIRTRMEWDLPLNVTQKAAIEGGADYEATCVSRLNEADRTERKRRLNLLHSRRKREKGRVEVENMKDQITELEISNKAVDAENKRLERLLHESTSLVAKVETGEFRVDNEGRSEETHQTDSKNWGASVKEGADCGQETFFRRGDQVIEEVQTGQNLHPPADVVCPEELSLRKHRPERNETELPLDTIGISTTGSADANQVSTATRVCSPPLQFPSARDVSSHAPQLSLTFPTGISGGPPTSTLHCAGDGLLLREQLHVTNTGGPVLQQRAPTLVDSPLSQIVGLQMPVGLQTNRPDVGLDIPQQQLQLQQQPDSALQLLRLMQLQHHQQWEHLEQQQQQQRLQLLLGQGLAANSHYQVYNSVNGSPQVAQPNVFTGAVPYEQSSGVSSSEALPVDGAVQLQQDLATLLQRIGERDESRQR